MKILTWTTLLLAAVPMTLMAETTKEDIKKLLFRGAPESVILNYIDFKGPAAKCSADDIIELKQAGATDRVIVALTERYDPSQPISVPPPARDVPRPQAPAPIAAPPSPSSSSEVATPLAVPPSIPDALGPFDAGSGYPPDPTPQVDPWPSVLLVPYPFFVPVPRFHQSPFRTTAGHRFHGDTVRGAVRGSQGSSGQHR